MPTHSLCECLRQARFACAADPLKDMKLTHGQAGNEQGCSGQGKLGSQKARRCKGHCRQASSQKTSCRQNHSSGEETGSQQVCSSCQEACKHCNQGHCSQETGRRQDNSGEEACKHCGRCASCFKRWAALINNDVPMDGHFAANPATWYTPAQWAARLATYPQGRAAEVLRALAAAGLGEAVAAALRQGAGVVPATPTGGRQGAAGSASVGPGVAGPGAWRA